MRGAIPALLGLDDERRFVVGRGEVLAAELEIGSAPLDDPALRAPCDVFQLTRSPLRSPSAMLRMIARCLSFSSGRSPPRIQMIGASSYRLPSHSP